MTAVGTAPEPAPSATPAPSAPAVSRPRPWGPPAAALAVLALLVAGIVGGALGHGQVVGLPDAGALVTWGLPVTRLVGDLAGIVAVGLLLAGSVLLPNREGALRGSAFHAVRLASTASAVLAAAALLGAVFTGADIAGRPVHEVLGPTLARQVIGALPQVQALLVQAALAAVVAVAAQFVTRAGTAFVLLAVALLQLAPPPLTGHSAAAGDHMLAVSSVVVHVLALALWFGGLGALLWIWRRSPDTTVLPIAVSRFSTLALWAAAAVGVSGIVNAAVRLRSLAELTSTAYGGLVCLKAAAFFALVAAGAWHRTRTLPKLATDRRAFARLAAAEVLLMAATVGLAVALSRTPTPAPFDNLGDTSQASDVLTSLLGFAAPPRPSLLHYVTAYEVDGFFVTVVVVAGVLYAQGVRALHRRGDSWPIERIVLWYIGLAMVLYATCGGLAAYAHILFSAHMLSHMVLSMIAPIPLVLAAPITLALRTLPAGARDGDRGPRQALLTVLHSRVVSVLTHPVVAACLFVGSLWGLYFTPLLDILMRNHLGHSIMAAHFLAVGCLYFYVLVGVDPAPRKLPHILRLGVLFIVMPFHAFFSVALMEENTVLAGTYYRALGDPYHVGLLADQQEGAGLGWALGEVPIVLVLIAIFLSWVRDDEREARRRDRAADRKVARGEEDELAAYNAWLAELNRRAPRE